MRKLTDDAPLENVHPAIFRSGATIPPKPNESRPLTVNKIVPPKTTIDKNDHSKLRQGRERHEGFDIGQYVQSVPMIFTRDGHNIWLGDMYRGSCAFLILGGPSFGKLLLSDKVKVGDVFMSPEDALKSPGFISMAVNNSPKTFRPNLWTCVDDPTHFIRSIWMDSKITKIVPFCHAEKKLFDNEAWKMTDTKVGDCPNTFFLRRNEHFQEEQFLHEDSFNWGNHKDLGGGRSVMLIAIRLLYYLGIRKVFLLGCDFNMDDNNKYHFDQDRTKQSQGGNNSTYKLLIERFSKLKPLFDSMGFQVFNCNQDSGLKVFPFISFQKAIEIATKDMPKNITTERTAGLYDRADAEKKKEKLPNVSPKIITNNILQNKYSEADKIDIKRDLDAKRAYLNAAKKELLDYQTGGGKDLEFIKKKEDEIKVFRANFKEAEQRKNVIWGIKK